MQNAPSEDSAILTTFIKLPFVFNTFFEAFKTNDRLMQVKSIAEYSAILLTFIKLPFVIKIFVLSIFEWLVYTGFTVAIRTLRTSISTHVPYVYGVFYQSV